MQLSDFQVVTEANRLAEVYPDRKIQAIKDLRAFGHRLRGEMFGLKEAKDIMDAAFAGTLVFVPNTIAPDEAIVMRSALEVLISANRSPVEVAIARRVLGKI